MPKYFGIFKSYIEGDYSHLVWKVSYRENATEAKKALLESAKEEERFFRATRRKTKILELVHVELANERLGSEILMDYEQEML